MPIDAYSSCPGGTGKKIKFCCPDLLGELEIISRMIEGEQFQACLSHIERLEEKHPDRSCLLVTKAFLLRELERWEEARATAAKVVEKQPENAVALAELTWATAATEGGVPAMQLLQRAMSASKRELDAVVYESIAVVGQRLAMEGFYLAARALFAFQAQINPKDSRAIHAIVQMNTARSIPLFVKEHGLLASAPADAPWKSEYDEVFARYVGGQWGPLAQELAALAVKHGNPPMIWRNIAILKAWAADNPGAIEAARKFSSLDVPMEDAAEFEALAAFLSEDPLGDQTEVHELEYKVQDLDQLQVAFSSSPDFLLSHADMTSLVEEGQVPPKAGYVIVDRPTLQAASELTLTSAPRVVTMALLFGRETDREARLEVSEIELRDVEHIKERLTTTGGIALGELTRDTVVEHVSTTASLLRQNWHLPPGMSPPQVRQFVATYEDDLFLAQWPKLPLGLFNGKSADDASADWRLRPRVLGGILLLEHWYEMSGGEFDFNRLRSHLGLPTHDPIDPEQVAVMDLPVTRLHRVIAEKLADEALLNEFRRAAAFSAGKALRPLAREMAQRPSMIGKPERISALSVLARTEEDPDRALNYITEGRKASRAAGQSCAIWDLMDLGQRLARRDMSEANRLLSHLQSQHLNEPGVADAVMRMLVEIGAMRPDGMPADAMPQPEPAIVVPGSDAAEPGKLWVPGGQEASGEKKIWTPGMD